MGNETVETIKDKFLFLAKKFFYYIKPILLNFFKKIKQIFKDNVELRQRVVFGSIFCCCLVLVLTFGGVIYMAAVFIVWIIMAYEIIKMVENIEQTNNKLFIILRNGGLIYISVCCITFVLIRESTQGLRISFWMFLTVFSVDILAYIFGKKFGKIPLALTISPGKTYEGAILGTIGGMFVSLFCYRVMKTDNVEHFSIVSFLIFSLIVVILAQLSDLSESYIKRQCNVKDSGKILPGHGGLFDRFDSFLIVAPFVFVIIWLNDGILF